MALLEQLCLALPKTMGIEFTVDILDSLSSSHKKTFNFILKSLVHSARQLDNESRLCLFGRLCDMIDRNDLSDVFIALSDMIKEVLNHQPSALPILPMM